MTSSPEREPQEIVYFDWDQPDFFLHQRIPGAEYNMRAVTFQRTQRTIPAARENLLSEATSASAL